MTHPMPRRLLALGCLLLLLLGLLAAGSALTSPPASLTEVTRWHQQHGTLEAAIAVIRAAAILATTWLSLLTALDVVADLLRVRRLRRLAMRLSPALWRNLVLRPLAVTAVAAPQILMPVASMSTAVADPLPVEAPPPPGSDPEREAAEGRIIVMSKLVDEPDAPLDESTTQEPTAGEVNGDELSSDGEVPEGEPDAPDASSFPSGPTGPPDPADTTHPPPPPPVPDTAEQSTDSTDEDGTDTRVLTMSRVPVADVPPEPSPEPLPAHARDGVHLVQPGEHLWSIAANHLGAVRGHTPTAAEIAPYWHRVIEHNRHALPDPANPDLLYPGIELQLPVTD